MSGDDQVRRHPNREEKRALMSAELARFVKQSARRAQKGMEPNDRGYDRELELRLKQMDPVELDRLLREDEE